MAVTLNNIKFYHPPSLPPRPPKNTSPNHNHTSIPRHTSNSTDPTPNHSTTSLSPFSQPALSHSLPPRPPAIFSSNHLTSSATLNCPSSISHTANYHPVCKNDFDQVLDEFLSAESDEKEVDEDPPSRLLKQDHGNENHFYTTFPVTQTTASLQSSGCTLPKPVESPAEAKPTHPKPCDESQSQEQPNDFASTTPMDTSPTFCTSEPHTSAPDVPDHNSTHTTRQAAAQTSSVPNQEGSETSRTSPVPIYSRESGGATLRNESMNSQGSSKELERARSLATRNLSTRKKSSSAQLPCSPIPLVVVPAQSCSALLRDNSSPRKSDRLQYSARLVEDLQESDSAPSDDENDVDYLDHSETEDARESLHPSKRRRRSPGDVSSASQGVPKHLSSEPPSTEQPDSPQENLSSETESIPIQGFLRLRTKGAEVIYTLEVSQTYFPSIFADKQMESPRPHSRTIYSTRKAPYSPEEDAFIMDLKARKFSWDEIEDQFAERFPYRKKTSLQVRYCTKLKPLTKESRKRRVKSCW